MKNRLIFDTFWPLINAALIAYSPLLVLPDCG